ncbi:unnamed protein product [Gongylonema pulchrum]|uniref:Uncharacterized protein n=1 Tax=Gongylonema pulchrum TaxID=637853 RepID=A0A183D993_9BILA|nr:unnamed protein product [Gongylonema pulchrum]
MADVKRTLLEGGEDVKDDEEEDGECEASDQQAKEPLADFCRSMLRFAAS